MRIWPRPSLSRRLVGTFLAAFALAGAVLMLNEYREFNASLARDPVLLKVGRIVVASLERRSGSASRRDALATTMEQFNALRAHNDHVLEPLLAELRDDRGALLYAGPGRGAATPLGEHDRIVSAHIAGKPYWVYAYFTEEFSLRIAEPTLDDVTVLRWILVELLPDMMLAFPFVLLPVWFAVRQGLQPLRRLTEEIARRRPDDFGMLHTTPRYAELSPLIVAFNDLLARLRNSVRHERAFVQDAAHELRTPMAVIATQAHALARASDDEERLRSQAALDHAIARASHLTRQLLELASLDRDADRATAPLDLSTLLQTLLAQVAPLAMGRRMELSLDAPDALPCAAETRALQSIVLNLLDNAIRYGREGGRIQVSARQDGGLIVIEVADDGPGIAPEEREAVFERFRRGADPGASGSGLGLAIVRKAAQRLRGAVTLGEGLDGRGAGFTLRFPAEP